MSPSSSDCLFCRIIAGELPARRVYETADVVAFLDIRPVHPGHLLVVPKAHAETLADLPEAALLPWISAAKRLLPVLRAATGCQGVNLLQNNGRAANQAIPHVHLHLIPRFEGDGLRPWTDAPLDPAEGDRLAEAMMRKLVAE